MDIGERIKKIRKENNLSQEQFAEKFHVTRQAVSNWEHGRNYPDMSTLGRISDEYGISFDELLKGDEELIDHIDKTRVRAGIWKRLFLLVLGVLVVFALIYALPGAVKAMYYDPFEETFSTDTDGVSFVNHRLEDDIQVFSTLRIPGHKFDSVQVIDKRMGRYDITISQSTYISGEENKAVSGQINRNHLQLYDPNVLKVPYGNVFEWSASSRDIHKSLKDSIEADKRKWVEATGDDADELHVTQGAAGNTEESKAALKELDADKYYEGYISFNNVKSYTDALKWIDKNDDEVIINPWVAVSTSDDLQRGPLGFYTYDSGYVRLFDKEKYPFLFGYEDAFEYWKNAEGFLIDEDAARQHFISMLKYLRDQKTFCSMLEESGLDSNFSFDDIGRTIDYVEKNGLQIYGVALTARKDTLLKIHEDPDVFSISTEIY